MWGRYISSSLGGWSDVTVGSDLVRLLFGAFDLELETSDCEKFRSGKVFGAATCDSGSGTSSGRWVAPGGPGVWRLQDRLLEL